MYYTNSWSSFIEAKEIGVLRLPKTCKLLKLALTLLVRRKYSESLSMRLLLALGKEGPWPNNITKYRALLK